MIINASLKPDVLKKSLLSQLKLPRLILFAPKKNRTREIVGGGYDIKCEIKRLLDHDSEPEPERSPEELLADLIFNTNNLPYETEVFEYDIVIFEYWAGWCKPCVEQMQRVEAIYHTELEFSMAIVKIEQDPFKVSGVKVRMKEQSD